MAEQINLTDQLKHYFGFDKFKGEPIMQPTVAIEKADEKGVIFPDYWKLYL